MILCCRVVLSIARCLGASTSPTHWMPVVPSPCPSRDSRFPRLGGKIAFSPRLLHYRDKECHAQYTHWILRLRFSVFLSTYISQLKPQICHMMWAQQTPSPVWLPPPVDHCEEPGSHVPSCIIHVILCIQPRFLHSHYILFLCSQSPTGSVLSFLCSYIICITYLRWAFPISMILISPFGFLWPPSSVFSSSTAFP